MPTPLPVPPPGRRVRVATRSFEVRAVAVLATVLCIATAVRTRRLISNDERSAFRRHAEARCSVDGAWMPVAPAGRASMSGAEILAASRSLEEEATTPEARHEVSVALLALGRPRDVVERLKPAVEAARDARLWNDLAAAYLEDAAASGMAAPYADAVGAADAALSLSPEFEQALFNRALALEKLGLADAARAAWQRYVRSAADAAWREEGLAHLSRFATSEPTFESLVARGDLSAAARSFPHAARPYLEAQLAGWAENEIARKTAAASTYLSVARSIAQVLSSRSDRFFADYVDAIESAGEERRRAIAEAHHLYVSARAMKDRPADALAAFTRAGEAFDRLRLPMKFAVQRDLAVTLYAQNRFDDARRSLLAELRLLPADYRILHGQVLWQLGLTYGANAAWDDALAAMTESLRHFTDAGETFTVAALNTIVAEIYDEIGDSAAAWRIRAAALRELGRTTTLRTQTCTSSISRDAAKHKQWRTALSFLNLEVAMSARVHDSPSAIDARVRRAAVRHYLGDDAAAERDLAVAARLIDAMGESGLRDRAAADRLAVEALLVADPRIAIVKLSEAVEFHRSTGRRLYLPTFLLMRGRSLLAAGDTPRALRDFDAAIAELEQSRNAIGSRPMRLGIFDTAEDLFEEAIAAALRQGDVPRAFDYAERSRARTLLDALSGPTAAEPNTAFVELVPVGGRMFAFVRNGAGTAAVELPCSRTAIATETKRLARSVAYATDDFDAASRRTSQCIVWPVEPLLRTAEKLVFVPDDSTASLPIATLRTSDGRYAIERFTVTTAPSVSVYERTPTPRQQRLRAVVVGVSASAGEQLNFAEREARDVAREYSAAKMLVGPAATRAAVTAALGTDVDVVHFAGHAASAAAGESSTCLLLAGGEMLEAAAVERLHVPGGPVVVLAGCNTSRGELRWGEGQLSLARSFLSAGASSVIATVARIDDADAAPFFSLLHRRLAERADPAAALRLAQLDAIHRTRLRPSIWAAVQAIGR